MMKNNVSVVYAQQKIPDNITKSIFLAGPTPRDKETKSWRPDALNHLSEIGFNGTVFVPEMFGGFTDNFEYGDQIEWEALGLQKADIIVFWVPRKFDKMPALTTNIEWGYWVATNHKKLILGYPENTPKMDYMRYYADKLNIPVYNTLEETLNCVISKLNNT